MLAFGQSNMEKSLFFDKSYIEFMSKAHPHIGLDFSTFNIPFFFSHISCPELLQPSLQPLAAIMSHYLPNLLRPKALVFGLPFEPYEQTLILNYLPDRKKMMGLAQEKKAEIILVPHVDENSIPKYSLTDFITVPSFPDMTISLENFLTFDMYMKSLPKRYRCHIRTNSRKFNDEGHFVERLSYVDEPLGRASYESYMNFYRQAKIPWLCHGQLYFNKFLDKLPGAILLMACDKMHNFIGMVQCIKENEVMHIARIGVEKKYLRKDAVFFKLFYSAIELAFKEKCHKLSLGPTAYLVKRRMGATPKKLKNLIMPVGATWRNVISMARPSNLNRFLAHLENNEHLEKWY